MKVNGCKTIPNISGLERRTSAGYVSLTHSTIGSQKIIELSLDSTTFATKEITVTIAYAPQTDVAAYLPPMRGRMLRWREAAPGSEMSEADLTQFLKTGFRSLPRVSIWDGVCELEHLLNAGLGKSLLDFRCPQPLRVMSAGSVRYWHQSKGQWCRATQEQVEQASRILPSGLDMGNPELGPQLLNARPDDMNVLLLSLDQKTEPVVSMPFFG